MSRRSPKISLGMPIYNGAAFLRETLDSLLQQTFGDFELIISDNASTDETSDICRSYAKSDPRIRYERLIENAGAIANFNRLPTLATGEYYKWVAADDLCMPTFLESTLQRIESNTETAWVHSDFGKIDQYGNVLTANDEASEGLAHSSQAMLPRKYHDSPRQHKRFQGVLLGTTWCADIYGLIRKSVLEQSHPMPTCYGAEKVLLGELALRGKYDQVPETLFYQRVHAKTSGSMTTREEQEAYMAPQKKRSRLSGTRLALLKGHFRSIGNVSMRHSERLFCLFAILQYLTQFSKWPTLFRSELFHEPIRRPALHPNTTRPADGEGRKLSPHP